MNKNIAKVRRQLKEFGADFRNVRRMKGYTLDLVHRACGVSVPTISRVERGDFKTLKAETYLILSDLLFTWQQL